MNDLSLNQISHVEIVDFHCVSRHVNTCVNYPRQLETATQPPRFMSLDSSLAIQLIKEQAEVVTTCVNDVRKTPEDPTTHRVLLLACQVVANSLNWLFSSGRHRNWSDRGRIRSDPR